MPSHKNTMRPMPDEVKQAYIEAARLSCYLCGAVEQPVGYDLSTHRFYHKNEDGYFYNAGFCRANGIWMKVRETSHTCWKPPADGHTPRAENSCSGCHDEALDNNMAHYWLESTEVCGICEFVQPEPPPPGAIRRLFARIFGGKQ